MDPYSVLGVRKSASKTEIELAYKGRRSQYHPDRYTSEGAETIAWATSMMQQVNQAYAVLSDPAYQPEHSHKAQGRERTQGDSRRQTNTGHAESDSVRDAASILLKPEWDWDYMEKIFARPNIPNSKLRGAIDSYAPEVKPGHVLILVDDTVFGGAKEGILVTKDAIYAKQKFEEPKRIAFKRITNVEPLSHSRIGVNGDEFFKCNIVDHLEMLTFSSRLAHVFQAAQANDNDEDDAEDKDEESQLFEDILDELIECVESERNPATRARLALCARAIFVTGLLGEMLGTAGYELEEDDEEALDSEVVRVELLAYAYSKSILTLAQIAGKTEMLKFLEVFGERVLAEYCIRIESLEGLSHLHGQERLSKTLLESRLCMEMSLRAMKFTELSDQAEETAEQLIEYLRVPALRLIYSESISQTIDDLMGDIVEDYFDDETTRHVLNAIDDEMDKAVNRYVKSIGGAG